MNILCASSSNSRVSFRPISWMSDSFTIKFIFWPFYRCTYGLLMRTSPTVSYFSTLYTSLFPTNWPHSWHLLFGDNPLSLVRAIKTMGLELSCPLDPGQLIVCTPKNNNPLFHHLSLASSSAVRDKAPRAFFPIPGWHLTGPVLCRLDARNHSCCEFMNTEAMPHLDDVIV